MIETRSQGIGGLTITQSRNHPVTRSLTKAARIRGFTLIEMLVVLVIMGIFVGLVSTITRPDDRALLRVEVERLAQLLDLATMQSRLTGKSIAWTADGPGYRFWRFSDDRNWTEILDDDALRARTLPPGMLIAGLRVDNLRPPEHMRQEFNAFGPTLSFVIDMSFGAAHYSVEGSPIGEVRILPDERKANDPTPPR